MKKERHGFLTFWLILGIVINVIFVFIFAFALDRPDIWHKTEITGTVVVICLVLSFITCICNVLLLNWKILGFYLYCVVSIISCIVDHSSSIIIAVIIGPLLDFIFFQLRKDDISAWTHLTGSYSNVKYKLPTGFIFLFAFLIVCVLALLPDGTKVEESKVEAIEIENGTITDERDGRIYKTVKIGKQTWMAENLNYNGAWHVGKCYNNELSNCEIYGKLYDWETAMKICPRGWHLPSNDEWDALYQSIGGKDYSTHKVETKLKAKSGWKKDGVLNNGTDDYGFAALPSGFSMYLFSEKKYKFESFSRKGYWWTATQESYDEPKCWLIDSYPFYPDRTALMSVRCVKDLF